MTRDLVLGRALPADDVHEAASKARVLASIRAMSTPELQRLADWSAAQTSAESDVLLAMKNLHACALEELASRGAL